MRRWLEKIFTQKFEYSDQIKGNNSLYLLYTSGKEAESRVTNVLICATFDIATHMLSISLFTLKRGMLD